MSLVADVIAAARKSGKDRGDVCGNSGSRSPMEEIMKRAEEARVGVCQALTDRYCNLTVALQDTTHLHHRVITALKDLEEAQSNIKNEVVGSVESSVGEVGGIVGRWREVVCTLSAAQTLLNIHTLLEEAHQTQLDHNFLTTARNLAQVEELIAAAAEEELESQLEILESLQEELVVRRHQLLYTIAEVWTETITWEEESHSSGSRSVTLVIKSQSAEQLSEVQQILGALYMLGELTRKVKQLGNNLMTHMIKPIITLSTSVKASERIDRFALEVITESTATANKPSALTVFSSLRQVFEVLFKCLLRCPIGKEEEGLTLMQLLGKQIGTEMTDILIKDCLAEAVPCSRKQLGEYDVVRDATQEFQTYLAGLGFYDPEEKSIIEYASNVDVVFSNKACAHHLERARELMTRPVHVTVSITPLEPGGKLVIQDEAGNKLDHTMRLEKLLVAKTFNLPKCQISKSICELVELLYEVLDEACGSAPAYAGRLFYTVRSILTLYCHVLPIAHAHSLATLPQYAAVVHNNCMYLGHHALLLGHQYKDRLPKDLREYSLTTVDLAHQVRQMAAAIFLKAMQGHRQSILDSLREAPGLDSAGCDASAVAGAEQGMRQVLHQLQLLHRVWQNVLPHTVYTKAMGTLVGSVVEELVLKVVGLEDISADAALALIKLLNMLKEQVPPLFQCEKDGTTHIRDILKRARMRGRICSTAMPPGTTKYNVDWEGQDDGPLAHEFTPDEAKQLIRALFQNTDRRAQVLAKIK
ncbi:unnamed protein product, partial [Meganyctiphanes norvegica]